MHKVQGYLPALYNIYMLIAEPRFRRILYFAGYLILGFAGFGVLMRPPRMIGNLLGSPFWGWALGGAILLGAVLSLVSILPGIWWVERAGIIAILTGVSIYCLAQLFLHATPFSLALPIFVMLMLAIRLLDIREFALSPREGRRWTKRQRR